MSQFDNLQKAFNAQKVKDENKDLITSFEPELDELFALDEDRVRCHVITLLTRSCGSNRGMNCKLSWIRTYHACVEM